MEGLLQHVPFAWLLKPARGEAVEESVVSIVMLPHTDTNLGQGPWIWEVSATALFAESSTHNTREWVKMAQMVLGLKMEVRVMRAVVP